MWRWECSNVVCVISKSFNLPSQKGDSCKHNYIPCSEQIYVQPIEIQTIRGKTQRVEFSCTLIRCISMLFFWAKDIAQSGQLYGLSLRWTSLRWRCQLLLVVRTLEQNEHGNMRTPRTVLTGLGWSFRGKQPERGGVGDSEGAGRMKMKWRVR